MSGVISGLSPDLSPGTISKISFISTVPEVKIRIDTGTRFRVFNSGRIDTVSNGLTRIQNIGPSSQVSYFIVENNCITHLSSASGMCEKLYIISNII